MNPSNCARPSTALHRPAPVGRPRPRARRGASALFGGAALTACLLGLPTAAQAESRVTPATTSSSLCSGVSPSQVSAVVGWSVPAATTSVNNDYFDQALGIHENDVECTYAKQATSLASVEQDVVLSYETLSKVPSRTVALRDIKNGFAKAEKGMPAGSSITYSITHTFGVTSIFTKVTAKESTFTFTFEFAFGWRGTKVAGGWVESGLPEAKVQALEKLALDNFGI